jgi:putative transposase
MVVTDNGPEFTSKVLDQLAYQRKVKLHFIRPGKPVENAYVESFNGKFRMTA